MFRRTFTNYRDTEVSPLKVAHVRYGKRQCRYIMKISEKTRQSEAIYKLSILLGIYYLIILLMK